MNKLFYENGIHYTLEPQAGFIRIGYTLKHIPSGSIFRRFVYIHKLGSVDSLLLHWNRFDQWKVGRI